MFCVMRQVIGADSGGPKDFVKPDVGELVPEVSNITEHKTSMT